MKKEVFYLTEDTVKYFLSRRGRKNIKSTESELKIYFNEKNKNFFTEDISKVVDQVSFVYDGDDFEEMIEEYKKYLLLRDII